MSPTEIEIGIKKPTDGGLEIEPLAKNVTVDDIPVNEHAETLGDNVLQKGDISVRVSSFEEGRIKINVCEGEKVIEAPIYFDGKKKPFYFEVEIPGEKKKEKTIFVLRLKRIEEK